MPSEIQQRLKAERERRYRIVWETADGARSRQILADRALAIAARMSGGDEYDAARRATRAL